MIQLTRPPNPKELTDEKVEELTKQFISAKESVWNKYAIKKVLKPALLELSHNKCCYCECRLEQEGKDMQVEHFHPKSLYPKEVMLWENLLPSCNRCNRVKGNFDTKINPIINPVKDLPKTHLKLRNYRFYPKTSIGKRTIDNVNLNDREGLVTIRFEIGENLIEQLDNLLELTIGYIEKPNNRRKNRILTLLKNLMIEATPTKEFSATAANILLNDPNYQEIKKIFIEQKFWNKNFIELEEKAQFCAL